MVKRFQLDKGLDLPLSGAPEQAIRSGPTVHTVGLVADDYVGMKPTMAVAEGDKVQLGQVLFVDKKTLGVKYTSPGAGRVAAIHRGAKRKFESIVIELDGDAAVSFPSRRDVNLAQLAPGDVRQTLVDSGLWTALRTRPFDKVPSPEATPYALFVTAIDTNPLAVDPAAVIAERPADFIAGLQALGRLTEGKTWLCKRAGVTLPGEEVRSVSVAEFDGPHPAGLPGTHMHFLAPVSVDRPSWHVGYQDVLAIGRLFITGELSPERVLSIAGPAVRSPTIVRSRLGASLADLASVGGAAKEGVRTISGTVFAGRALQPMHEHLGRRHLQVTQLVEGTQREFLGWMGPGLSKFSVTNVFGSSWLGRAGRRFGLTTSTEGSHRAIVPIGVYERVMPLDIIPTPLLKSLAIGDTDAVQMLGGMELAEEDLGLCSFVCSSKNDYGPMLRAALATIEREG